MTRDDWIRTLSIELSRQIIHDSHLSGAKVEALIRVHCPFKLPRCKTCVYWTRNDKWTGSCRMNETYFDEPTMWGNGEDGDPRVATSEDFGCVRWKEKS